MQNIAQNGVFQVGQVFPKRIIKIGLCEMKSWNELTESQKSALAEIEACGKEIDEKYVDELKSDLESLVSAGWVAKTYCLRVSLPADWKNFLKSEK